MDLESKAFKIALKELPKEYKMDEKKVFNTTKAVQKRIQNVAIPITGKKTKQQKPKRIQNVAIPIKDKKLKKNITKKYKSKK